MNCHYCGAELHDNEIFCRNCGTRREIEEKTAPVSVAVSEEAPAVPVATEAPAPRPMEYKEKTLYSCSRFVFLGGQRLKGLFFRSTQCDNIF